MIINPSATTLEGWIFSDYSADKSEEVSPCEPSENEFGTGRSEQASEGL
ncbi:MAG: hypothetical protein PF517_02575 [Salinivirgaceae bacterium]|nr:hypothetical protein [Salinivirgaceae bacterium]